MTPVHSVIADPVVAVQQAPQTSHYRFHQDHVLGTSLDVVIGAANPQDAHLAFATILQEIERLDQILSVWRDDSEISALNRNDQAIVSPELFEVIAACEAWRGKTCGAFDARLGHLLQVWEQQHTIGQVDPMTRDHVLSQLSHAVVQMDTSQQSIQKDAHITFAPDAYAKGYIIDRALVIAREAVPTVQGLLVDIGGDIRVWGQSPQAGGWQIGVRDALSRADNAIPSQVLNLNNQAIAFSGQGARQLAGQAHWVDPQTGLPINHIEQCVVVGSCAADADALATALAAMSPMEGLRLIEQLVGYEAQLISKNGQLYQSTGWSNLISHERIKPKIVNTASDSSTSWPTGYQAKLDVIIPKIKVDKYRAPYLSIWVTDAQKKIVRTLAVWGKEEKWIDSNYVWWRRYGRHMDNLDAVAKPSRQPGQYSMVWDGKDDKGQSVSAGQYLIHIETSRENGEHTYQTFELEVAPQASTQTLPAQAEVGALKLSFQRVI
jgi:FAD:protein FMN transferase